MSNLCFLNSRINIPFAKSARRVEMMILAFVLCVIATPPAICADDPPAWERPSGWTTTTGGEGGRVIAVETLLANGPGSLAEALAAEGARTIVFKIGGVIDLAGSGLKIRQPHVTIAGETAPSPGITLVRGGVGISASDVIVRHLRVRVGEAGRAKQSGWEVDGVATSGAHDVIIDHCSISWATDENLSASGPRFDGTKPEEWRTNTSHRITFNQCLVAEGLSHSTHAKGPHSMGSLVHDNTSDIAIIGNLYISNGARNPLFKGGARGIVVNNLIHNPGGEAITYGLVPEEWEGQAWQRGQMSIVGNVIRRGPSSGARVAPIRFGSNWGAAECDAYVHDNLAFDKDGAPLLVQLAVVSRSKVEQSGEFRLVSEPPTWPKGFKARPSATVKEWVLANVGSRPWDRDPVDRRLVEEARAGGGKIIDSEAEVGGYDALSAPR